MSTIDLVREPADGEFSHGASQRKYQVTRRDNLLWHREVLRPGSDSPARGVDDVVLAEHPVKYVVGSGHHSLTYLVEIDGFLTESPATWYRSQKNWGLSPGYDRPNQTGFERPVTEGCLFCHAGRVEAVGDSLHRINFLELAIGCERCHGPGQRHVEKHQAPHKKNSASNANATPDYSIVNPAHLSRELSEAVCQQCHLRSAAVSLRQGRVMSDYRPGLPLQAIRLDYRLRSEATSMTVVGHVEQLHLSRCYQQSGTLTCLTCHAPHETDRKNADKPRQSSCLTCHQPQSCRADEESRRNVSPGDDCVQCHMPQADTEIPHLAFTHHRIGIHTGGLGQRPDTRLNPALADSQIRIDQSAKQTLQPILSPRGISSEEQERLLGFACLDATENDDSQGNAHEFRLQALQHLERSQAARRIDPRQSLAISRLQFELDRNVPIESVKSTLTSHELTAKERCHALLLVAEDDFSSGRFREARSVLKQLTTMRRQHLDWLLIAECNMRLGDQVAQVDALLMATRINPRLWRVHQSLGEYFRKKGEPNTANWHFLRAVPAPATGR